ncbi:SDR family NAD(P)-dependent oxidoreductase [Microbacterium sp. NPDC097977]|uniref:SDR family NAD(P)-dependent oxidoreductase n=1 Tax=Microbacterium sp. NPDC097977 TaxID=3155686 RepID=UPI00332191AE
MNLSRLDGRTILVTGASGGIGYFIAEGLARRGARLIVAARSTTRAEAAIDLLPEPARHRRLELDLSNRESVRSAGALIGEESTLDGLVMNAGVIAASPTFMTGAFGAESTVDVNVVAHMELLRLALPALERAPSARVISTGSMLTKAIPFDLDNWRAQTSYRPRVAYAMSKHAAEILGFELDRRLIASGSRIRSVVSHPGGAIDALTPDRPPLHQRPPAVRLMAPVIAPLFSRVVQGKESAAQSAIAAVAMTTPGVRPYIGPRHGATGTPHLSAPVPSSSDETIGAALWTEIEGILGASVLPRG